VATSTYTPVVTTSTSGPNYEPYRKALEEIVYSKKTWHQADSQGNQSLKDWAKSNAQPYYSQLPTELAQALRGMNYEQANQYVQSLFSRTQPQIPDYSQNPYDKQVADLINRMNQSIGQPTTTPYDAQIAALLAQISSRINNPTTVDPRTTDEYAAGKAAIDRQVADNIRVAQEALGASGFARSTNLAERAQSIADAGTEYLETQLVPQIAAQIAARDQQGLQNSLALLQGLMQQQQVFDARQQAQMQNLSALLSALTGQQGLYDTRQQTQFQNQLGLAGLDLQRQAQDRAWYIDQETLNLQRRAQEFNEQQAQVQNERARINEALQRTQTLGRVANEQDAAVLGVPVGTPTFQAVEAAAQRQQQLDIVERQIAASMAELRTRLNFEAEQNRLAREAQSQSARISDLLRVWEATGVAPPGLESLGIRPGQEYTPYLTPGQQIDQLQLEQMLNDLAEQRRMEQLTPVYQQNYSLDPVTAQAMVSAMDNPTLESALADIKAHENQLRQMGVDTKKLRKAVEQEFKKQNAGPPIYIDFTPNYPQTVTEYVFGKG